MRGQSSVEYMIILAAVLIILAIVVSNTISIPQTKEAYETSVNQEYWASADIGILSWVANGTNVTLQVQNNLRDSITITAILVNDVPQYSPDFNLSPGQNTLITMPFITDDIYDEEISFTYNSLLNGLSYTFYGQANLKGTVIARALSGASTPTISSFIFFTDPTPSTGTTDTDGIVPINVSIQNFSLTSLYFNWNGTNVSVMDNDLVLAFNFDNSSLLGENSTLFYDISASQKNGTCSSCPDFNTSTTKHRYGYSFNGVNDQVNVNGSGFNFSEEVSVELWVYPHHLSNSWQCYVGKETTGTTNNFYVGTDNFRFWMTYHTGSWNNHGSADTYTAGQWYHIVGIRDNSANLVQVYVDGELSNNATDTDDMIYNNGNISIGNCQNQEANATIDSVRIWNRTLTPDEIRQHYMSDLYKYSDDQWYLEVNQTLNSTVVLANGTYNYRVFGENSTGNETTESRSITVAVS